MKAVDSETTANNPPVTFLNHKFVRETVHLDESTSASASSSQPQPQSTENSNIGNNNSSNPNNNSGSGKNNSTEGNNEKGGRASIPSAGEEEQVEIKVEEGYATRQMDEYFRQTIAAIKEELTKKLETKEAPETDHHHHRHHLPHGKRRDRFDSDSDTDEDDEDEGGDDDDDELASGRAVEEKSGADVQSKEDYYCANCLEKLAKPRNNRAYIYQSLIGKEKTAEKDKVTPCLVLVGCMLNQFIIEGLCFNYANLFDFIQKELRFSSKLIATMPGALLLTFFLLLAPIAVFMSKQFGTRRTAIIGTFISTLSLLICSFFSNIVVFVVFYGVLTGKSHQQNVFNFFFILITISYSFSLILQTNYEVVKSKNVY